MYYTITLVSIASLVVNLMSEGEKRAFVTRVVDGFVGIISWIPLFILGVCLVDWSIITAKEWGWIAPARTEQTSKAGKSAEESSSEGEGEEDDAILDEEDEEEEEDDDDEEEPPVRAYTQSWPGGCRAAVGRFPGPMSSPRA